MKEQKVKFVIRQLPITQISVFFRLHDSDYFEKLSNRVDINAYSQKLYENAVHFILYDGSEMVGFCPCYFNNKIKGTGYISSLTIKKKYNFIKLGSSLLEHVKEYAKKNGFNNINVSINCNNETSAHFYKKNGFEIASQDTKTCICTFKYIV